MLLLQLSSSSLSLFVNSATRNDTNKGGDKTATSFYLLVATVTILLASSISIHPQTHRASKKNGEAINNNELANMNIIPFFLF
jgi:hypothetical protein